MSQRTIYFFTYTDDKYGVVDVFFNARYKMLGWMDSSVSADRQIYRGHTNNVIERIFKMLDIKFKYLPREKEKDAIQMIGKELGRYDDVARLKIAWKESLDLRVL